VKPLTPKRLAWTCGALAALLVLVVLVSLKIGAVQISIVNLAISLSKLAVGLVSVQDLPTNQQFVLDYRLGRILMGILVGASLSVAGAGFQALLRNPLADPYVLGVSSGAALGAIFSLIIAERTSAAMPFAAFAGAALTIAAVYLLGRRSGHLDSYTLLLAGFITASFLSAVIMFLMTTLPGRDLRGMAFWLMGDLSSPLPVDLKWLFIVLGLSAGAIYTTAADLNLLLTGEQEATHLGVDVPRVKLVVYVAASLLTGVAVSISGAIGFVGFLVPHLMRLLFGTDYRLLIPTAALGGAIAIVVADTLARTVVPPTELPVGAITAIAGAPVFLYLLRRRLP
jgi:iron complex transport system permease protein